MSDGPPLRTRFHRQETSPGLLLWQVTHRWQAAQRATLAPFHLTHVQFVLLACLTWLQDRDPPGPITQRKLAEFAATDPMMTSQVLRRLSAAGRVTRSTHPHDTRAKAIAVTGAGRARVNEAIGPSKRATTASSRRSARTGPPSPPPSPDWASDEARRPPSASLQQGTPVGETR